jgi:hypothetical protein
MRLALALAASTMLAGMPAARANTHTGNRLFMCTTPEPTDLDATGFAALTWVEIKGVGSHGATGTTTNILTYNTWDTQVAQKAKGISDAGSPVIELARIPTDPGQMALRAAGLTNFNYAFKIVANDAPTANGTPTIRYNRGLVTGPTSSNGRVEDFDLEMFTLGLNQKQIIVDPTTGS